MPSCERPATSSNGSSASTTPPCRSRSPPPARPAPWRPTTSCERHAPGRGGKAPLTPGSRCSTTALRRTGSRRPNAKGIAMGKTDRERRHQANLDRINRVQLVCGTGDRMRVDHEGTLLERARMLVEEISSHQATELGLAAFDRLLRRAEERDVRHRVDILAFVAAVWNNKAL